MAKIFISYRHDDSQTVSDSIYTYLAEAFGSEAIWRDKEDIHPWHSVTKLTKNVTKLFAYSSLLQELLHKRM
jgi:hypothetical protein